MEQLSIVHKRDVKTDTMESHVKTAYLYNARFRCEDNSEFILPYAHLNHYSYKSKKHSAKQHVLTQITLWDKSTLPANCEFVITAINDVPFRLWASTDEAARLTARDLEPAVRAQATELLVVDETKPTLKISNSLRDLEHTDPEIIVKKTTVRAVEVANPPTWCCT